VRGAPVELLERVTLFSGFKRRELEQIAGSMRERVVPAGEALVVEGTHGVGFFVVESGTARVTVDGGYRRTLGPADYFGEVALIADSARTATVTAETPLRCYGLTSWEFRPLVQENAAVAWSMLEALAALVSAG
jgi:CRP/FNR family cyclic AMP-dependent transcriptional regulator